MENADKIKIEKMKFLHKLKNEHQIWSNQLLEACKNSQLTLEDYKFIFSQYYFYSKNFTKLLAAGIIRCDKDLYRAKLAANLWEEGGAKDITQRHSEIYRIFLEDGLKISITDIHIEKYTIHFFKEYLSLCLESEPDECAAILSFATESIVSRLYAILKQGLLSVAVPEEALDFFNIHIACDDAHAATLEEMTLSYIYENNWTDRCGEAVTKALDLRDAFFTETFKIIQAKKFETLIDRISSPKTCNHFINGNINNCYISINEINNKLYVNEETSDNISFTVDRVPFLADVLDPRVVHISVGNTNELHSHAHETIFLILEGVGEVILDNNVIPIKQGDLVFVPRWLSHQTRNTGEMELKFFAVTDYGLTKRLAQNSETIYRQKNKTKLLESMT